MPVTLPPVEASSSSRFFHGAGASIGARKKSIAVQMKPRDGPGAGSPAGQRKQLSSIALRTEPVGDDAGGLGNDLLAAGDDGEPLSGEQIQQRMREGLQKSWKRIIDLFRSWDDDGDGTVSKEEFRRAIFTLGLEPPGSTTQAQNAHIGALFDAFDPDGSGSIEMEELRRGIFPRDTSSTRLADGTRVFYMPVTGQRLLVGHSGHGEPQETSTWTAPPMWQVNKAEARPKAARPRLTVRTGFSASQLLLPVPTRGGGVAYRLPMNPPPAQPRFIGMPRTHEESPAYIEPPEVQYDRIDDEEDLVPPPLAAARAAAAKHDLLFDLRAFERKNAAFTGFTGAAAFAPRPTRLTLTTRIDALKASRTGGSLYGVRSPAKLPKLSVRSGGFAPLADTAASYAAGDARRASVVDTLLFATAAAEAPLATTTASIPPTLEFTLGS